MRPPHLRVEGGVRAVLRLCIKLGPGICLTTEENHGKTSVRSRPANVSSAQQFSCQCAHALMRRTDLELTEECVCVEIPSSDGFNCSYRQPLALYLTQLRARFNLALAT